MISSDGPARYRLWCTSQESTKKRCGCGGSLAIMPRWVRDRKSTRLNSSHTVISYAVFCLKKKKNRDDGISDVRTRALMICLQAYHTRWCKFEYRSFCINYDIYDAIVASCAECRNHFSLVV